MSPLIGVTSVWSYETYPAANSDESFIYAGKAYSDVVFKSGGVPIILVPPFDESNVHKQEMLLLDKIDGLLLTGGGSGFGKDQRSPSHTSRELSKQQPKRYSFESDLIKEAWKREMPVLGICRGHQMIAEVLGGTIKKEFVDGHSLNAGSDKSMNDTISLVPESKMSEICGSLTWCVNSFHIQVVENIPDGFRVAAWSHDGYIEAMEAIEKDFFFGVQFHPEELFTSSVEAQKLIQAFMEAANRYRLKDV